jgi:hypothetical protein
VKRRRRSRSKKSNRYFTKVHEDAIVRYCQTDSKQEKSQLYGEFIAPVFNELVDKIVFTFRFTSLPNIDELREECKVWLTTILDKYNPGKGSTAFSYFSVVTKNWFIAKSKRQQKRIRREIDFADVSYRDQVEYLSYNHDFDEREDKEFFACLFTEINRWEAMELKDSERKVLDAVKVLLDNPDQIEIFNKKAIYLYLREITGMNTKQVVRNLNKLRIRYRDFKTKWNRGDI